VVEYWTTYWFKEPFTNPEPSAETRYNCTANLVRHASSTSSFTVLVVPPSVQECNLLFAGSWAASEMKCERTGDDIRLAF